MNNMGKLIIIPGEELNSSNIYEREMNKSENASDYLLEYDISVEGHLVIKTEGVD